MSQRSRLAVLSTVLLASVAFAPVAAASPRPAATTCTVTTLPMPPGATDSYIAATNGRGVYVGTVSFSSTESKAAIWRNGGVQVLEPWFSPSAMSSSGLMSGQALATNGRSRAAKLQLDGQIQYLGEADTSAVDINERGDVIGSVPIFRGSIGGVWPAGQTSGIGLTPYGYGSTNGIDDSGYITGSSTYNGVRTHYIWRFDGTSARQVRQYESDSGLALYDVDDGQVAATRKTGSSTEIVVINAATGAISAVQNTSGAIPAAINDGIVIGSDYYHTNPPPTMWRNGETVRLPAISGGRPWQVSTVNGDGTEITGNSVRNSGGTVATIWRCS